MRLRLREVRDDDVDALFEMSRDPEAVRIAAFTHADPDDRAAHDAHLTRILSSPDVTHRVIEVDGELVGTIGTFTMEGDREITYWIDRQHWGRGIASRAVEAMLELDPERPLWGRAASDNVGSLRVLERAGFVHTGTDVGYAAGRGEEIEETILRLDA